MLTIVSLVINLFQQSFAYPPISSNIKSDNNAQLEQSQHEIDITLPHPAGKCKTNCHYHLQTHNFHSAVLCSCMGGSVIYIYICIYFCTLRGLCLCFMPHQGDGKKGESHFLLKTALKINWVHPKAFLSIQGCQDDFISQFWHPLAKRDVKILKYFKYLHQSLVT